MPTVSKPVGGGLVVNWKQAAKENPELAPILKPEGSVIPLAHFWAKFKAGEIETPTSNGNGNHVTLKIPNYLKRFVPHTPQIKDAIDKSKGFNRVQWRRFLSPELYEEMMGSDRVTNTTLLGQFAKILRNDNNGEAAALKPKRKYRRHKKVAVRRPEQPAQSAQLTPQTLINTLQTAGCNHCPNCGYSLTPLFFASARNINQA